MWTRRPTEPAPDVAAALASLERLAADHPELAAPARTLGRVLAAAFDRPAPAALQAPIEPALAPRFRAHPPTFDPPDLRRRAVAVARALEPDNPDAAALHAALDAGTLDLAAHLVAALAGSDPPPLPASVDAALVDSVAHLVALPSLAPVSDASDLNPQVSNLRFSCPFCDSVPLLAEARGLEQHRVLRCGLCAAAWPMPRLACPACAAAKLDVFHVEGEEQRHRLLLCRTCGLRLKVVSTLAPLSPSALLVADLASIQLDLFPMPSAS